MGLFKPDLYRSFAVGFVLGTALMGGVLALSLIHISEPTRPY